MSKFWRKVFSRGYILASVIWGLIWGFVSFSIMVATFGFEGVTGIPFFVILPLELPLLIASRIGNSNLLLIATIIIACILFWIILITVTAIIALFKGKRFKLFFKILLDIKS